MYDGDCMDDYLADSFGGLMSESNPLLTSEIRHRCGCCGLLADYLINSDNVIPTRTCLKCLASPERGSEEII